MHLIKIWRSHKNVYADIDSSTVHISYKTRTAQKLSTMEKQNAGHLGLGV